MRFGRVFQEWWWWWVPGDSFAHGSHGWERGLRLKIGVQGLILVSLLSEFNKFEFFMLASSCILVICSALCM